MRKLEKRTIPIGRLQTREDGETGPVISGYFAKYGTAYEVCHGWVETIAPGAFRDAVASGEEIKALWNHDRNIPLGSTGAGTATLREDEIGLWAEISVNTADRAAMDGHARCARGDVTGASFGFEGEFDGYVDADGVYRSTLVKVTRLYEISPCTFPAYEATEIHARDELSALKDAALKRAERERADWKNNMKRRLNVGNGST